MVPEKSKNIQSIPKIECELCGGNHEADQCPHERRFSSEINTTNPDRKGRFPDGKSRSVDYSHNGNGPQYGGQPNQSMGE